TLIVPSVGPAYGTMMDQITTLRNFNFPTVMILPMQGLTTDTGVATGFRKFVETLGKPAVLYIKFEGYLEPETVAQLVNDGLVSWIKYAIVRDDPAKDHYLSRLVEVVDPRLIVSGIGEQPAITHLTRFRGWWEAAVECYY
ncbi:dihydrodipicolinate synthase family protein, partial [Akkermansiaceae bacterium]|nr:dihydrodipicolinate synthase family protein [Akkermansiaceae bacterium]